jgi:phospholipase/carboxylesterase
VRRLSALLAVLAMLGSAEVITRTERFPVPLGYTVELPDGFDSTRTYPLIIAIHGLGDRMSAYVGTASRLCPEGAIGLYPESPYPMPSEEQGPLGFTWEIWADTTEWYGGTLTRDVSINWIVHVIEKTIAEFPVDPDKVFLFGFSQGGMLTYQVGLQRPELFAGLLPAGGWLPLDSGQALPPEALTTPVRILHGVHDDVCEFSAAQKAFDTLAARGLPVELLRYPAKHTLPKELVEDARDFVWKTSHPDADGSLDNILFPEEPVPASDQVERMLAVLSVDAPPEQVSGRLLKLYDAATDTGILEQVVYLLGARRCTEAEEFLTRVLRDTSGTPALRQAAYSALVKLGTGSAWKAVEQTGMEVAVREVVPGSQADSTGIKAGDVLLSYDGRKLGAVDDLRAAIAEIDKQKTEVVLVVRREGEEISFTLEPGRIGVWLLERPK